MNINEIIEQLTENEIKIYKQNAVEIPYENSSLLEVVFILKKLRSEGNLYYYINFNGIKLYSIDTTIDTAFLMVYSCSFEEYLQNEYSEKIMPNIEGKNNNNTI